MNNKTTVRKVSELDDVISTLAVSGYSEKEIEVLTGIFNEDTDCMNDVNYLTRTKLLEMNRCLSKEWIVQKLRFLAEGTDPIAAVKALKVLSEISERR